MTRSPADLDTAAAVLEFARARGPPRRMPRRPRSCRRRSPGRRMHSVDSLAEAATVWDHGETGIPVAGPGAPLIGEFSVTEFAAAIGLPTEAGKAYLGEAVELRYRLGRVWSRVVKGDLPAWRARRIARATIAPVGGGRRVRGPPRRAHRAQGPPRPGRPAGRGGDRAVHARGGRTPPPPGRRRPVLHHRHEAALAARAPAPCTASSTSPTPSTSTPPSPPGRRR